MTGLLVRSSPDLLVMDARDSRTLIGHTLTHVTAGVGIVDAHRAGRRYLVHPDELLTGFPSPRSALLTLCLTRAARNGQIPDDVGMTKLPVQATSKRQLE